jgi:protein kinase A
MLVFDDASTRMVDFGFAKVIKDTRTFTVCGSPAYTAPEVIQPNFSNPAYSREMGYSYECDIWSWGVVVCELIGGFNPF